MMWGDHHARSRALFADQFEATGAGDYLYRRNLKSAGIRVSASERDVFVARFGRDLRRAMWGLIGGLFVVMAGLGAIVVGFDYDSEAWPIYAVMAVWGGVFWLVWRRVWYAPARALAGRPAVGADRSRAEVRDVMMARLTWGQIMGGGAMFAFLVLKIAAEHDMMHGWGRLWPLFFAGAAVLFVLQVFRKWQHDNRPV